MPRRRIAMYHLEEILRLRHEAGRTQREIASGCGMAQSSVHKVLTHAKAAGVGWPLPEGLDEPALHCPSGSRLNHVDLLAVQASSRLDMSCTVGRHRRWRVLRSAISTMT